MAGLTAHLAATFRRFADQLGRARAGSLEPPFPPGQLSAENLRAVAGFHGDPTRELAGQAQRFLGSVSDAAELIGHQQGTLHAGLQVMFGLNELAVHHDDLAHALGGSYRPPAAVVCALACMYDAVFGLPPGPDLWERQLRGTGR